MSDRADKAILNSLGALRGNFITTGSATLGTSVAKITMPTVPPGTVFRLTLATSVNSNDVAYMVVPLNSGAPVFTADWSATAGAMIPAGSVYSFNLIDAKDLYICGGAASTKWNIAIDWE